MVTVPGHTTSGAKLRLRGKGVPATKRQSASDLIVHLEITLPDAETPDVKSAIEALEKHGGVKGSYLAAHRICRCHPWGGSGIDNVPD